MTSFKYIPLLLPLLYTGKLYASEALEVLKSKNYTAVSGELLSYADVVGESPMYVKFWATWCVPCMQQMPHFQHAYEEYGDKVKFVSINLGVNETPDALAEVIDRFELTMPILQDNSGELAQAFGLMGTPWHILVTRDGRIVHKGHDADATLDKRLALVSARQPSELPAITLVDGEQQNLDIQKQGTQMLYFTATWCDWYLKDSRPEQSQNCIAGQQFFNQLSEAYPTVHSLGIVSRLWTGQTDLNEYREKFAAKHPLAIDTSLDAAIGYGINQMPTLVIIKEGKEVLRINSFASPDKLLQQIQDVM
ncbi:TlpA family protein disulfide reductase [Bowmanella yangjiangensis]|uniref:Redoxin family protein n=1 Tax=Bowmanella yangjiangensis TaxID=2811230 RepID=A0ABS3CV14_9ALTE|nr:redoxin family protein [Bowmanella yangjiangensis]MBN7819991.1 redoxin family protein [Bowmanella yangjiangensis]